MNPIKTGRRRSRIREWGPDLFGQAQNRWRVIRTSNAYTFANPKPCGRPPNSSKSDLLDRANSLHQALARWGEAVKGAAPP